MKKIRQSPHIHFYGPNMTAIYDKYLERGGRAVFHPVSVSGFLEICHRIYELADSDDYIRDMKGYDAATGKMLVCVNPQWFRPTDVDNLWGDPTKAKTVLGWNPQKTSYEELVEIMAKNDRELAKREKAMKAVM